MNWDNLNN